LPPRFLTRNLTDTPVRSPVQGKERRAASSALVLTTVEAVRALPARPFDAQWARRSPPAGGGPEGKLRGRPPPPQLPRSGPWRRTGSESITGRARTRLWEVLTNGRGSFQLAPKAYDDSFQTRFLRSGSASAVADERRLSRPAACI